MDNDDKEKKGFFNTLVSNGLKAAWKKLPVPVKLKIIGGLGLVFLLFIFVMVIFSSSPFQFLNFSFNVNRTSVEDKEFEEQFANDWYELCTDKNTCSEKQLKQAEALKKSQEKFYKKFQTKTKNLSNRQKVILLTTLFFNTNIDDFTESGGAYEIVDDEEDNTDTENNTQNLEDTYKEAKDTISKLVKHINSEEEFYEWLLTSDFLDKREQVKSYYIEYASNYGLDTNISKWSEADKKNVREEIVYNIKMIVEDYGTPSDTFINISGEGLDYWWPIGSKETQDMNGIIFASGEPESTTITSKFGNRNTGIEGASTFHRGIDIGGVREGGTNVIASLSGTVIQVENGCANGTRTCGAMGNHVSIQDIKGNVEVYEHLYQNSITVSKGDKVYQGQVIAKTGNTGVSSGAHLHFTIKINGTAVDPLDYVDPKNPRPVASSSSMVDFHNTVLTKEEFIAKLTKYYTNATSDRKGFEPFKNEILNNNGAEIIYDTGVKYNINPELLSARCHLEGYSPGTNYNFFGWSCNNEHPENCSSFISFSDAVDHFFKGGSNSTSLEEWMFKYAYIGKTWLNPGNSGDGGCYYYNSIKEFLSPERSEEVAAACASDKPCSGSECLPTTNEDQDAYRKYQVKNMKTMIDAMFR